MCTFTPGSFHEGHPVSGGDMIGVVNENVVENYVAAYQHRTLRVVIYRGKETSSHQAPDREVNGILS